MDKKLEERMAYEKGEFTLPTIDRIEEAKIESVIPEDDYFNPNDFYRDELPPWNTLWDYDQTPYSNLKSIVSTLALIPNYELLAPIICSYLFQPTRPAKCLPILCSYGKPGSGKSNLAYLAAILRGLKQTFTSIDTFSSVRNALDLFRYYHPEDRTREKEGAIICWDNFSAEIMRLDVKVYQMLLVGYHIRSAQMMTAGVAGLVYRFNTFAPKILSTIDPLQAMPEFSELHRRLWVIPHKKYEEFTNSEKLENDCESFFERKIEFEGINWNGINALFLNYWGKDNCRKYAQYRSYLSEKTNKQSLDIPAILQGSKWDVCVDPIVTGLVIGAFDTPQNAIYHIAKYYEFLSIDVEQNHGTAIEYLKEFIASEHALNGTRKLIQEGNFFVDPATAKSYLETLSKLGKINEQVTPKKIQEWFDFCGYQLTTKGWIRK